jgi:HAD superfamily hydrolase (TIGR01509 family)
MKAVLLDVDGTLVQSNGAHAQAWARALAAYGYEVAPDTIRRWIGMGGDRVLRRVDERLSDRDEPGASIQRLRQEIFLREYAPGLAPADGARALLRRIGAARLLRVVATSAKAEELSALLKAGDIEDQVDLSTTSDDVQRSKPAPDIVDIALAKAACTSGEAIYLGDTPYDIRAAHGAGVRVIALCCGGWDRESLAEADAVYEDPAALLRDFERLKW